MEAARAAFPGWSARSPQERSQVLHRLADLLEKSLEDLAQAESRDQGECSRLLAVLYGRCSTTTQALEIHTLIPVGQGTSCLLTMDGTQGTFFPSG